MQYLFFQDQNPISTGYVNVVNVFHPWNQNFLSHLISVLAFVSVEDLYIYFAFPTFLHSASRIVRDPDLIRQYPIVSPFSAASYINSSDNWKLRSRWQGSKAAREERGRIYHIQRSSVNAKCMSDISNNGVHNPLPTEKFSVIVVDVSVRSVPYSC